AVVGEPEAAARVEHEVVRAAQRATVALGVEVLDLAGLEVDALDAPADVRRRLVARHDETIDVVPLEAAVVADVELAVGPERGPVRATADLGHDARFPVGRDACDGAAPDLGQDDAAVRHPDRAL